MAHKMMKRNSRRAAEAQGKLIPIPIAIPIPSAAAGICAFEFHREHWSTGLGGWVFPFRPLFARKSLFFADFKTARTVCDGLS